MFDLDLDLKVATETVPTESVSPVALPRAAGFVANFYRLYKFQA
jgi:hypothetical protein